MRGLGRLQPKIGQNPGSAGIVPEILGRSGRRVGVCCNLPATIWFVHAPQGTASAARNASCRHGTRRAWKSVSQKVSFPARHDTFSGKKCLLLGILRHASAPSSLESRLPCLRFLCSRRIRQYYASSLSLADVEQPLSVRSSGSRLRGAHNPPRSALSAVARGICYLTLASVKTPSADIGRWKRRSRL